MAQDDAHVYWVNDDGRLFGAPKDGGPAVGSRWIPPGGAPISALLPGGCKLVIDGGYAYTTLPSLGKIARVSLFTNGVWVLGDDGLLFGDLSLPSSLTLDANAVYVTQSDTALLTKVPRPPLAGADAGSPDGGAVDGGAGPIFNERTASRPSDVVAGPDTLYWFDATGLRRMDKAGGTIATVATNFGVFLAPSGSSLFWRESADEAPFFVSVAGGNAAQVPWQAWAAYRDMTEHGVGLDQPDEPRLIEAAADKTGCQNSDVGGDDDVSTGPAVQTTSDAGVTDGATLALNGNELVFSTDTVFHRASIPDGAVSDMFIYRGACSGSSHARIVLVDATQVFWADSTTVWRHPRN
jgi:hypothetical protein